MRRFKVSGAGWAEGAENAGDRVDSETDPGTGIISLSTYRKKPAEIAEMIGDLDVVLFDIQDIGVRSYTYIYSMAYLMQAAAIAGKKVIILDRPNPINGIQMEGNILDSTYSSFVGMYPIPYRHGMTTGELALLFNSEYGINCDLEVVAMDGWTRNMWYEDTDLPWVPTSPHVPDAATILPMIATGTYGELGMLSEGVGTTIPFEYTGGPWITDPHEFARAMETRAGEGVIYRPTFFKPYYGRHKGLVCGGLQLYVTDRDLFSPYLVGLMLMSVHQELFPEINLFENENRFSMFAKVMGSDEIRLEIQKGTDPKELEANWMEALHRFGELRKKYLDFYKKQEHVVVESASLIPDNDPTTLFTGSGMQPMVPFLLGEAHPEGKRVTDSQKCLRTQDIEEVGDNRHTTFFEMLGNWSLGDYFKKEQIPWIAEFLFEDLKLDPNRLYVTCYKGTPSLDLPKDEESADIWQGIFKEKGIDATIGEDPEKDGMGNARIFYYDESKNWWSRIGIPQNMPAGEPGGPDTEMFWDFSPGDESIH